MLKARLKQGFFYIFCKYNKKFDSEVMEILSDFEFLVFSKMSDYDKLHSYLLMKKVKKSKLSGNILYLKLALLHDCGKENIGLLRRIKKVIFGDKLLENHTKIAYEKLKEHNIELAKLCIMHHDKNYDKDMEEFQKLDDE